MAKMNEMRRIVEGTSAFLHYEYCCQRGNLFTESYLSSGVGNILQSLHGGLEAQVVAGYQHPVLSNTMIGGGRRPELDFVVTRYDDSIPDQRSRSEANPVTRARKVNLLKTAIEAKWAGSSHCTISNILWDLIRLEMLVAQNPEMTAILLIAGEAKKMDTLPIENVLSLLPGPHHVDILTGNSQTRQVLMNIFQDPKLQLFEFPEKILISSAIGDVTKDSQMKVAGWQIASSRENGKIFKPSDVKAYKTVI